MDDEHTPPEDSFAGVTDDEIEYAVDSAGVFTPPENTTTGNNTTGSDMENSDMDAEQMKAMGARLLEDAVEAHSRRPQPPSARSVRFDLRLVDDMANAAPPATKRGVGEEPKKQTMFPPPSSPAVPPPANLPGMRASNPSAPPPPDREKDRLSGDRLSRVHPAVVITATRGIVSPVPSTPPDGDSGLKTTTGLGIPPLPTFVAKPPPPPGVTMVASVPPPPPSARPAVLPTPDRESPTQIGLFTPPPPPLDPDLTPDPVPEDELPTRRMDAVSEEAAARHHAQIFEAPLPNTAPPSLFLPAKARIPEPTMPPTLPSKKHAKRRQRLWFAAAAMVVTFMGAFVGFKMWNERQATLREETPARIATVISELESPAVAASTPAPNMPPGWRKTELRDEEWVAVPSKLVKDEKTGKIRDDIPDYWDCPPDHPGIRIELAIDGKGQVFYLYHPGCVRQAP